MNLTEIATREQTIRGSLKLKRQALATNRKEAASLEKGIAEDLAALDDLQAHAQRAFEAARATEAHMLDSAAALSPPAGGGEGGSPGTPPDAQPGEPSPFVRQMPDGPSFLNHVAVHYDGGNGSVSVQEAAERG